MSVSVIGFVESCGEAGIVGWAARLDRAEPVALVLHVDGIACVEARADGVREDVLAARADMRARPGADARLGFRIAFPPACFDDTPHLIELRDPDGAPLAFRIVGGEASWPHRVVLRRTVALGWVTAGDENTLFGWAVARDNRLGELRAGNDVLVTSAAGREARFRADFPRPDVTRAVGAPERCGFRFLPPPEILAEGPTELRFTLLPEGLELPGSPVRFTPKATPAPLPAVTLEPEPAAEPEPDRPDPDDPRLLFTGLPRADLFGIGGRLARLRARFAPPPAPAVDRPAGPARAIAPMFEAGFYLATYPDVRAAGVDPIAHYLQSGWREGRKPAPWFDTAFYLAANDDVREAGINPFWHYVTAGRAEGRAPSRIGGARRTAIEEARPPAERTRNWPQPPAPLPMLPGPFARQLAQALEGARGLALVASHDNYTLATGGVQLVLADEQRAFAERGLRMLHLSPVMPNLAFAPTEAPPLLRLVLDGRTLGAMRHEVIVEVLAGLPRGPGEERIFAAHSLLGHHPETLAGIVAAFAPRASYFWLHDYASLCEGYNLLRNDVAFCRAPAVDSDACRVCIYGDTRAAHLERQRAFLASVPSTIVAPSRAALDVWRAAGVAHPHLAAIVHPHAFFGDPEPLPARDAGEVRIAFVGYMVPHKGWPLFLDLVHRTWNLGCYRFFQFVVPEAAHPTSGRITQVPVKVDGANRRAMEAALAAHAIDVVMMLSPWPETFSFVTMEAMAAGADVVALADSGNVADLVLRTGRGIVARDEAALIDLVESLRLADYVRQRREAGMARAPLRLAGTTAGIPGALSPEAGA